jgi:phage terminase large subunit
MLRGRGYDYDTVYLPHDGEHNRMESINTIAGQFKNAGFRVDVIPNTPKKLQIQAGANVIAASEFDSKKCHVGIEALKSYRWNYNKILDETTKTPVHDWASHPADALMCGALGKQEERKHMGPIQYDSRGIV